MPALALQPNKRTMISGLHVRLLGLSTLGHACNQTSGAISTCNTSCPGCMLLCRLQEALPLLRSAYPPQQSQQLSQSSVVTRQLLHQLLQLSQGICVLLLHADKSSGSSLGSVGGGTEGTIGVAQQQGGKGMGPKRGSLGGKSKPAV